MPENTTTEQKINEAVEQGKQQASQFGQALAEKVDAQRDAAANRLHNASEAIHAQADRLPAGSDLAHSAAERVDAVAGYMAEHDTSEMAAEAGSFLRRHPGVSVMIGIAAGFVIGRALIRS